MQGQTDLLARKRNTGVHQRTRDVGRSSVMLLAIAVSWTTMVAVPRTSLSAEKRSTAQKKTKPTTTPRQKTKTAADHSENRIASADASPPESLDRLDEITKRAQELNKQREAVERERRPYLVKRDSMLAEVAQARKSAAYHHSAAVTVERQISQLDNQINWIRGPIQKNLKAQQTKLKANLNTLVRRMNKDRELIEDRVPQIHAANSQIALFDQRLLQFDEEVKECRNQWLQVRRPLEKYACADFEGVQTIVNDWLVLDGQWPEAFAWAALCAYEQDDYVQATNYLEKAHRLADAMTSARKQWPQLEALTALIRGKQIGQSAKANAAISNAIRVADKDSDWETYYLLGRCYLERPEEDVRAKTHFQHAITIHPTCDCAKLWLARLQTTSARDDVRDVRAGTESLEQLWQKSDRRSWRLACFLADAYSAYERTSDAEAMWKLANELVPEKQTYQLAKYRRQ